MTTRLIAGLMLLAAATGALGQEEKTWQGWENAFEDERKGWKEIEVRIPAYPEAAAMRQLRAVTSAARRLAGHRHVAPDMAGWQACAHEGSNRKADSCQ